MVTLVPTTDEDYCEGACHREEKQRVPAKNTSTIDCVGYAVSRRQKIPFLTGDREFEDIKRG